MNITLTILAFAFACLSGASFGLYLHQLFTVDRKRAELRRRASVYHVNQFKK